MSRINLRALIVAWLNDSVRGHDDVHLNISATKYTMMLFETFYALYTALYKNLS